MDAMGLKGEGRQLGIPGKREKQSPSLHEDHANVLQSHYQLSSLIPLINLKCIQKKAASDATLDLTGQNHLWLKG
ncbi:hypothetical protein Ancab_032228 [Ancistrocladus abbreviatus]